MTTASTAALAAELTLLTCDQPLTEEILVAVHDGLARIEATGGNRTSLRSFGGSRPALRSVGTRPAQLPVRSR